VSRHTVSQLACAEAMLGAASCTVSPGGDGRWPGVDEAVVGRLAQEAGRSSSNPIIDWVHGDSLLFAFLCAGLVAGFVLGFFGRALFAERVTARREVDQGDA
jgi:hypothetical protein